MREALTRSVLYTQVQVSRHQDTRLSIDTWLPSLPIPIVKSPTLHFLITDSRCRGKVNPMHLVAFGILITIQWIYEKAA